MIHKILPFLFLTTVLNGEIHVFNRSAGTEAEIKTLPKSKLLYISVKDLARSFTSKMYENIERKKTSAIYCWKKN